MTGIPKQPHENLKIPSGTPEEPVAPIFRLGDDTLNREVMVGGVRLLSWESTDSNDRVAQLAGWSGFTRFIHEKREHMQLPNGTRSARSVLSGIEAWEGEKKAIVDTVASYLLGMQVEFGANQVAFSWAQVGITPDQHIFIAPPNVVEPSPGDQAPESEPPIADVVDELAALLQNDSQNRDLVDHFAESLQEYGRDVD